MNMTDELVGQDEQDDGLGAVRPSRQVQAEIIEFLRNDTTRLGQVFQGREREQAHQRQPPAPMCCQSR